jgi:hypothetical protein
MPKKYVPYTEEIAKEICRRMAEDGRTLTSICSDEDMPTRQSVMNWSRDNEEFRKLYEKARADLVEFWMDQTIDIADDGSRDYKKRKLPDGSFEEVVDHDHIARARLRVDTRKFAIVKILPNKTGYGDRVSQELTGANGGPIEYQGLEDLEIARRMVALLDKATNKK